MKRPSDIRFADKNIQDTLYKLENGDNSEKQSYKFINQALDNIEENHPFYKYNISSSN